MREKRLGATFLLLILLHLGVKDRKVRANSIITVLAEIMITVQAGAVKNCMVNSLDGFLGFYM